MSPSAGCTHDMLLVDSDAQMVTALEPFVRAGTGARSWQWGDARTVGLADHHRSGPQARHVEDATPGCGGGAGRRSSVI